MEKYDSLNIEWIEKEWPFTILKEENNMLNNVYTENLYVQVSKRGFHISAASKAEKTITNEDILKTFVFGKLNKKSESASNCLNMVDSVEEHDILVACKFCKKAIRKHKMKLHMKKHSKDFTCDMCGKEYTQYQGLSDHMSTHTGIKDHLCEYCGKMFTRKFALKDHINIHTGERPYTCKVCGKGFSDRSTCKKHMESRNHSLNSFSI